MNNLFPNGYPIEVLEGERVPTDNEVKRAMASRCAWLIKRIEERARFGERTDFFFMELASIAKLMDLLEGRNI